MKYKTAIPFFPEDDRHFILLEFEKLLAGDGLLSMGRFVSQFEQEFSNYVGVKQAIATTSCTAGLETILRAAQVGRDSEVIVPVQTFIATASSVIQVGATPVFAEVDENFLLCFDDMKSRVTEKTKAVILVHFAGLISPDVFLMREWLNERNIVLIEDAAHAHGAQFQSTYTGALGDAASFSFYSTKNITTGEGGMITTNHASLGKACASIRSRGLDLDAGYEIFSQLGTNQRVTEVQALMGITQIRRLAEFVDHRNQIANIYDSHLKPLEDSKKVRLPTVGEQTLHAYWRYIVFLNDGQDREMIKAKSAEVGIKIDWAYHPLVHLQPAIKSICHSLEGDLPYSEQLAKTHICLPIHVNIQKNDAVKIINQITQFL